MQVHTTQHVAGIAVWILQWKKYFDFPMNAACKLREEGRFQTIEIIALIIPNAVRYVNICTASHR